MITACAVFVPPVNDIILILGCDTIALPHFGPNFFKNSRLEKKKGLEIDLENDFKRWIEKSFGGRQSAVQ